MLAFAYDLPTVRDFYNFHFGDDCFIGLAYYSAVGKFEFLSRTARFAAVVHTRGR